MENFDYKKYSLKNLKDAVCDSIETECTPEEISEVIVDALQELVDYHLERMNKAANTIAQIKSTHKQPNLRIMKQITKRVG